uniref:DUF4220 domain-containing protein n=1 Tax=Aegilops tauschii TaxID=37682 RepID=N1R4V3_AEGTA
MACQPSAGRRSRIAKEFRCSTSSRRFSCSGSSSARATSPTAGGILLLYFLLCWVYNILRVTQRMKALRKASSVHGLVRNAKVVADYTQHIYASGSDDMIHSPMDMAKCKYLVLGEGKDSSPPSKAPCYLSEVGGEGKLVTFDMIWNSKDKLLLSPDDDQKRALKDTCLSFALFKLLKRRFCPGLHISEKEKSDPAALEFVVTDGEHAFHLVEVELSFLYDFFYTNQAIVFILFNNILVVFMILSIDILQDVATAYSNWAILHYVCDYVTTNDGSKGWWMMTKRWWKRGFGIRRALIKWVAARQAKNSVHWRSEEQGVAAALGAVRPLEEHAHGPRVAHCRHHMRPPRTTGPGRGADQLPSSRRVATTVSSYCAYLLAFVPDMVPNHSYTASQILDAIILDARERLGTTKTLSERCEKMLQLGKPDMVQDMSILILGANLADKLLSENKRPRWKLLAGFWADLVLFLAPSDKADVHADHLATGGEFMTHLWALLTHAGIVHRPDIDTASHA